jgi:gliding motility-associated-like protein
MNMEPVMKVAGAGTYWVKVNNSCGNKTDSLTVYAECNLPVYMPAAFSPNGDGLNDLLRMPSQNKNHFVSLTIYNRWGELVFRSRDSGKGWDGKQKGMNQPTGVYVYHLEMKGLSGEAIVKTGTVTLVR